MRQSPASIALWPLGCLYGLVIRIRNWLFDIGVLKQEKFPVCTVVVGNLSVGGTGKTPHVISLAGSLAEQYNVAILTRGYKRSSKGFRWVEADDDVNFTGDEALEMKTRLSEIPVATDGNRRRGISIMLKELFPKPDIIILDDGFQHRRVKPDFSILLTKISCPFSEDYLLPAGRLREPRKEAKRAQAICITGNQQGISIDELKDLIPLSERQILLSSQVKYSHQSSLTPDKETGILLITSIADPSPLLEYLESTCGVLEHLKFRDHHAYSEEDIQKIIHSFDKLKSENKLIVTTGKDMVKLKQFAGFTQLPHTCLEIDIEFLEEGKERLIKEITSYVRKN